MGKNIKKDIKKDIKMDIKKLFITDIKIKKIQTVFRLKRVIN